MGDQPVTKAYFDGLAATIKALPDEMAAHKVALTTTTALTAKIDDIINNINNQNRGGEPIKVHDGNNQIIKNSSSLEVKKVDVVGLSEELLTTTKQDQISTSV